MQADLRHWWMFVIWQIRLVHVFKKLHYMFMTTQNIYIYKSKHVVANVTDEYGVLKSEHNVFSFTKFQDDERSSCN